MGLANTLRFIVSHPLNRGERIRSINRYVWWQLRSRIGRSPVLISFVGEARLLVSRGQTGATGNVYTGLHELQEMAFTLHFLRAADLFVDVGANVGTYTILAAAAVGANCLSFEPDSRAFDALEQNVRVNGAQQRVRMFPVAVGSAEGETSFTVGKDTLNHVLGQEKDESSVTVKMTSLDAALAGHSPTLIKIDVEGFEAEVIRGAERVLANPALLALIVETNGSGTRYNADDQDLYSTLRKFGFTACSYDAMKRSLVETNHLGAEGNTIFVRDLSSARSRVQTAPRFDVAGRRSI